MEEYGVTAKDSAAIAAKFAGMHFGEIKNLTMTDSTWELKQACCLTLESTVTLWFREQWLTFKSKSTW